MKEPIMKILKQGASDDSVDISDYRFHSKFSMLKYHSDTIQTMTINAGDTEKIISFAHGLNYIPENIGFIADNNFIFQLPYRKATISGIDDHFFIYADDTNIYIKYKSPIPHLQETYYADGNENFWSTFFSSNSSCFVGKVGSNGTSGALRFTLIGLDKNESIISAYINYYVGSKGSNSNYLRLKTYGIDEDNTTGFNDPMGRTKTTAYTNQTTICPPIGEHFTIDVRSQIEEINSRAGWVNGNAMGFLIYDDGSNDDVNAYDSNSSIDSRLVIQKSGSTVYSFRIIVFKDKIA